jgi:anti-anti-sigma regulatory factor
MNLDITEQRIGLYNQLSDLLAQLLVLDDLDTKLKLMTDWIVAQFGADFSRIWVIQAGDLCKECIHAAATEGDNICVDKEICLHLKSSSGRYTHIDGQGHRRVPFGAYKIGRIAAGIENKFLTNDVQHDPRVHNNEWAKELGLVSFAGYKLSTVEGEVLGVLALFSQHPLSPEEDAFLESVANMTSLVVWTTEAKEEHERLQQDIIEAQQRAIAELSTPVIPIMDRIIVMPLIGSIDSMRARDITRSLLAGISQHRAKVVILDVTGVSLMDTGIVNHLNKTIQAARLKGAYTIVTGISDAVAEAIVDLGIDWGNITTLSDLQTGLIVALDMLGIQLDKA